MKAEQRRKEIVLLLRTEGMPLSGNVLAERLGVSRQIIVQDVSVLKSQGYDILSTRFGYILQKTPQAERIFKVYHTREQTERELSLVVGLGGTVEDVFVWHKVYGKVSAPLHISSPYHISRFLEGVRSGKSTELMQITGGYHYHTVCADSETILDHIEAALQAEQYLVPEQ